MNLSNKKKCVLSLAIILALLAVTLTPLILPNNQPTLPLAANTLTNSPTTNPITSKANPQPQPNLWWNYSWNYRMEVNVTEPGYADRINEIAQIQLNFTDGHCANDSIRVLYYNASTAQWVEVPIQIENGSLSYWGGGSIRGLNVLFLCNVTKSGTSTYYVYYNDSYNIPIKTYTTPLSINIDGNNSLSGTKYFLFGTGVISGWYNLRTNYTVDPDTLLFFDDDACFRVFNITFNGTKTNVVPTTGLHSGLDRIDADDLYRWNHTLDTPRPNQLNWTAQLLEYGPLRAVVRVYKTSTDKFTWTSGVNDGSYNFMNKTFTFYAYQGYVKVNIVNATGSNFNTVPIYDFAVLNITSQWTLYVDSYNLGPATSWTWTDKISSPQPFNYMSLVRNDGLGFALLGSPLWPEDDHGSRTSVEFGYGDIEKHNRDPPDINHDIRSFLIRNDGRPGDVSMLDVEYPVRIPFTYYISGITQGFNEVVDNWYRVNNPTQPNNGTETNKFYPLIVNVTDAFGNAISGANVTIYNDLPPASQNMTPGITNSLGLVTFLPNKNSTINQYYIQANKTTPYWNYTSNAIYWYPKEAPPHPEIINIQMNITTVYAEVWDNNSHRVQTANVTLNYVNASLTDISQNVDLYYANCSFYAWANVNLTIEIYINATLETGITVYNYGTNTSVTQPINISEPKAFRVLLNRDIYAVSTTLTYLGDVINKYWTTNASFYVWFNVSGGGSIDNADWVNYTIYYSGVSVYNGSMTNVTGQSLGNYYANFNTSLVGLFGDKDYTITITAKPHDLNQLYPIPINIYLLVKPIPVEVTNDQGYSLDNPLVVTWSEDWNATTIISVRLQDTINNLKLNNANVNYSISPSGYSNESMIPMGNGLYKIPEPVAGNLTTGNFTITIVSSLQNYSIQDYYIKLTINLASAIILVPSTKIQGSWNQDIPLYAEVVRQISGTRITNASVSWIIQGTNINGTLNDTSDPGNYSGQIPGGTLTSGNYILIIAASKPNYATNFTYLSLEVQGAQTVLASAIMIPQLFGGSSEYLFAGPLVQVENWWLLVPISFTYVDSNGNPVPNATITVAGGLPVIGGNSKGGIGASQVHSLQLPGGAYLVLIPISGFPPTTLPITIQASANNFQTQQIQIVLSVKEKALPIGPFRIPLSTFLLTIGAIAVTTSAFGGYSFYKRAKIPAIIKRIDELIRAISRGEKVTVKLIPREKVIADLLSEELALVGVEPRVERYIPMELADLIVPLLVESGMQQREAYALAVELKTASPADKERLLESVGIPGETSARIIQTIEEYEEKQEPFRRATREKIEEPEEPEEPEE